MPNLLCSQQAMLKAPLILKQSPTPITQAFLVLRTSRHCMGRSVAVTLTTAITAERNFQAVVIRLTPPAIPSPPPEPPTPERVPLPDNRPSPETSSKSSRA
ncbi:hypothetical protein B0H10DRAFT_2217082 [Mycena sp. CBHHK59/15]|nr:hypothetical protein B0H10DRAFT_2217082 [Mycena sp. CBHHK59/15]